MGGARGRPDLWKLLVVLGLTVVLVGLPPGAGWTQVRSPSHDPSLGRPVPGPTPLATSAGTALSAAAASLRSGAGPANGSRWSCDQTPGVSLRCGLAAASVSRPAANASPQYSWLATPPEFVAPANHPGSAMTFDPKDGYVVMFEATDWSIGSRTETWTFANDAWRNITSSAGSPPLLTYPGFAFDAKHGVAVLFGGYDSSPGGLSNSTWGFSGGSWKNLTDPNGPAPSPRASPGEVFDESDGYLLLFGGVGASAAVYNDSWAFDGTFWSPLALRTARVPPHRLAPGIAYDARDGFVVMYGGILPSGFRLEDTWTYQNRTWTYVTPPRGVPSFISPPVAISLGPAQSILLIGCFGAASPIGNVWTFLAGNWSELDGSGFPTASLGCFTTVAAEGGPESALLLATGPYQPCAGETWTLNGSTWRAIAGAGIAGPCPSWDAKAIYDAADQYVVVFGGGPPSVCCGTNSTWTYANGVWTNITNPGAPAPRPLVLASFAYDVADGYGVLFGGQVGSGCSNFAGIHYCGDTWEFSNGTWRNATNSTTHPSPRGSAAMAFDGQDGYLVLFGGTHESNLQYLSDTWSFSGGKWTNLSTNVTGSPPGRQNAAMSYDPALSCVLMFGGFRYGPTAYESLNDTWCYAGKKWTVLSPTNSPPPTTDGALAYDPTLNLVLLAGGWNQGGSGVAGRELWGFNGTNWSVVPTTPSAYSPLPSDHPTLVYDGSGQELLLIGGDQYGRTGTPAWSLGHALRLVSFWESAPATEPGSAVYFDGSAGGGSAWLSYRYVGLPSGCASVNLPYLLCVPNSGPENASVTFVVSDAASRLSVNATLRLTVVAGPTIVRFVASPQFTDVGQPVSFNGTTVGGFGSFVYSFSGLPDGCLPPIGPVVTCTPLRPGEYRISLTSTDAYGIAVRGTANLTVHRPPSITGLSISPSVVDLGQNSSVLVQLADGTPPYRYSFSAPLESCRDGNGGPSAACSATGVGGQYVTVTVTDAVGVQSSAYVFSQVNALPRIAGFLAVPPNVIVGNQTQFLLSTTGGTGPLSFRYSGLPAGCASSDVAELTCNASASGDFTPTVTVRDATGAQTEAVTPLHIGPVPPAPVVSRPPVPSPLPYLAEGLVAGALIGVAAVIVAAALVDSRSRRRRRPPLAP
jgi:galactose oxidase-like protein